MPRRPQDIQHGPTGGAAGSTCPNHVSLGNAVKIQVLAAHPQTLSTIRNCAQRPY